MVIKFNYWEFAYPRQSAAKTQRLEMTVEIEDCSYSLSWGEPDYWSKDQLYIEEVAIHKFKIECLGVRVNNLPWGEIAFDENLILYENGGEDSYPEGKRISEIFQVYNVGKPLDESLLMERIEEEIGEYIKEHEEVA